MKNNWNLYEDIRGIETVNILLKIFVLSYFILFFLILEFIIFHWNQHETYYNYFFISFSAAYIACYLSSPIKKKKHFYSFDTIVKY